MSITQQRAGRAAVDLRSLLVGLAGVALIVALSGVVLAAIWDDLPERIVTGWDADGDPDRFTDRSARFAALTLGIPAFTGAALAALLALVPRSMPGGRWVRALPVGIAAAIATVALGTAVQQRDGGTAEPGRTILLMVLVGAIALAATAPLMPRAHLPRAATAPPADAPHLTDDGDAWWVGTAPTSALATGAFAVLLAGVALVLVTAGGVGWPALLLLLPALLVAAMSSFRVTIGGRQVVASGALFGRPTVRIGLESVERAEIGHVRIVDYGGIGLRGGPRGVGIITRGGEALVLHRTDGTRFAITCDDAESAAATVNTLRARMIGSSPCSSD